MLLKRFWFWPIVIWWFVVFIFVDYVLVISYTFCGVLSHKFCVGCNVVTTNCWMLSLFQPWNALDGVMAVLTRIGGFRGGSCCQLFLLGPIKRVKSWGFNVLLVRSCWSNRIGLVQAHELIVKFCRNGKALLPQMNWIFKQSIMCNFPFDGNACKFLCVTS